jgi:probable FeS assembly SUF system protein SufT
MKSSDPITLNRDCAATQVPSGQQVVLPAGTQVVVTQSLGGTYTVMANYGYMVRIDSKDADAIGMETTVAPQAGASTTAEGAVDIEELVWDQLKTCYDPEIPVNVVDLGLIYHCQALPLPEGGNRVEVKFTLTAPGCGMGEVLKVDVENRILALPGVKEVDVEVVFEPLWSQDMMSDAAKLELGLM